MNGAARVRLASRGAGLPAAGPDPAVAAQPPGQASAVPDQGARSAAAAERARVLAETARHWRVVPRPELGGSVLMPVARMIRCAHCGGTGAPVVRGWRFHIRPGKPTVPHRCDVHLKCSSCAAGWWHGVAVSSTVYWSRPRPRGIRALLTMGSHFEPMIWAGNRRGGGRS